MPEATLSPALARAESLIRSIPDYPEPGIIFRDITPLLADAEALRVTTEAIIEPFAGQFDVVAGISVLFEIDGLGGRDTIGDLHTVFHS